VIGVGAALGRAFRLNADTMGKLNLYAFVPALMFTKLAESGLDPAGMARIAVFWTALVASLLALSAAASALVRVPREARPTVAIGSAFTNSGNFGIPAASLAFGPAGVEVQAVVLAIENVLFFNVGLVIAGGGRGTPRESLRLLSRQPVLWAVPAALLVRARPEWVPVPVSVAVATLGAGLVPLALVTLGAQLAGARPHRMSAPLGLIAGMRLAAAPLVAAILVRLLAVPPAIAPMLVVAAGFPCAVNTVLLAIEFRRSPALASNAVFWTTLSSALTTTAVLALVR
jgi:predicted permease